MRDFHVGGICGFGHDGHRGSGSRVTVCEPGSALGKRLLAASWLERGRKTTAVRSVFGWCGRTGSDPLEGARSSPEVKMQFGQMPEERGPRTKMNARDQLVYRAESKVACRHRKRDGGCRSRCGAHSLSARGV